MELSGASEIEFTTAPTSSGTGLPKREANIFSEDMEDSTDTENTKNQLRSELSSQEDA